jgi:hypothetical protein
MAKETIGLLMPLKERDTSHVLHVITNNSCGSLYPLTSKTDLNFLVCGGAPGIGPYFTYLFTYNEITIVNH